MCRCTVTAKCYYCSKIACLDTYLLFTSCPWVHMKVNISYLVTIMKTCMEKQLLLRFLFYKFQQWLCSTKYSGWGGTPVVKCMSHIDKGLSYMSSTKWTHKYSWIWFPNTNLQAQLPGSLPIADCGYYLKNKTRDHYLQETEWVLKLVTSFHTSCLITWGREQCQKNLESPNWADLRC